MLAQRLLELQAEYTNHDAKTAEIMDSWDLDTDYDKEPEPRSKDEIAAEYETVLSEFITTQLKPL